MISKNWQWCRNNKYNEQQKAIKIGDVIPPEKKITPRAVQYVFTKLHLFTKENKYFSLCYYIDSIENETGVYLCIPWLFYIDIVFCWDNEAFNKRWPYLHKYEINKDWGVSITREYLSLKWAHMTNGIGIDETGFYWLKDWSDMIRGKLVDVTWKKEQLVLKTNLSIITSYKVDSYDETSIIKKYDDGSVEINVPVTVYRKIGIYKYKRWFRVKRFIYEVAADTAIIVPGKNENFWYQDDELIKSKYNPETGTCDFSSGAKTPEEAASAYVNSIRKKLTC